MSKREYMHQEAIDSGSENIALHYAKKSEDFEKRIKELEAKVGKCLWFQDEDGIYDTDCDNRFELVSGTLKDNKMKYCPYCGKLIEQTLKG